MVGFPPTTSRTEPHEGPVGSIVPSIVTSIQAPSSKSPRNRALHSCASNVPSRRTTSSAPSRRSCCPRAARRPALEIAAPSRRPVASSMKNRSKANGMLGGRGHDRPGIGTPDRSWRNSTVAAPWRSPRRIVGGRPLDHGRRGSRSRWTERCPRGRTLRSAARAAVRAASRLRPAGDHRRSRQGRLVRGRDSSQSGSPIIS